MRTVHHSGRLVNSPAPNVVSCRPICTRRRQRSVNNASTRAFLRIRGLSWNRFVIRRSPRCSVLRLLLSPGVGSGTSNKTPSDGVPVTSLLMLVSVSSISFDDEPGSTPLSGCVPSLKIIIKITRQGGSATARFLQCSFNRRHWQNYTLGHSSCI